MTPLGGIGVEVPNAGTGKQTLPQTTILLVDDEPNVLVSLSMNLRRRYTVVTANSGAEGVKCLAADPGIAVIVSDMRMPGMDGAAFLAQARGICPDAVRMLLTGQTDMGSAIAAVNEGQIFRFLTKPTSPAAFLAAVESAMAQHRLITAEKVLLEETLRGSLRTMSEILAVANPALFGRATRIKRTVRAVGGRLGTADHWQIDVAAMLSQLAQVSLPTETAEKLTCGADMSPEERAMIDRLPEVTDQLLANIPRLETVRAILAKAQEPYHPSHCMAPEAEMPLIDLGANIIKAATAFDALTQGGLSSLDAVRVMRAQPRRFDHAVLVALGDMYSNPDDHGTIVEVAVMGLMSGMVLAEDLVTRSGVLLVTRGFEVTPTFMQRIRNFKAGSLKDTVRIVRGVEPVLPTATA